MAILFQVWIMFLKKMLNSQAKPTKKVIKLVCLITAAAKGVRIWWSSIVTANFTIQLMMVVLSRRDLKKWRILLHCIKNQVSHYISSLRNYPIRISEQPLNPINIIKLERIYFIMEKIFLRFRERFFLKKELVGMLLMRNILRNCMRWEKKCRLRIKTLLCSQNKRKHWI